MGRAWRRACVLLQWRRHDSEMAEEIALHEAMKRDAFIAQGMTHADASHAARRAMGNPTTMQESAREVWRVAWLRDAMQDAAYGARTLRRNPTFALVAVLGLAFGLGFSAAVFTGYNAFAMRGWDLPDADRVVALWATTPGRGESGANPSGFSLAQTRAFAERARTLDGISAYVRTGNDGSSVILAAPVGAGYFDVVGIPMARGRAFAADEDRIEAPARVMVVSHRYWTTTLASNPAVLGTSVKVNGVPFTVIGVAAEGFGGTNIIATDVWIPLAAMPVIRPRDNRSQGPLANRDECCLDVMARLAPGVSRSAAEAELTGILARMARAGTDTVPRVVNLLPFTFTGMAGPRVSREVTGTFLLIGAGVAVVLLLACANIANLLLARATTRQREMGIRLAMGASRGRIVRQLMTESLLLALLASIPALLIASWAPGWIIHTLTDLSHTLQFSTDRNVLLFTVLAATICCALFGLAPALHASRPLQMGRTRLPLRSIFLSAQVTFCVVLLVVSGLLVRSASIGRNLDLGFATKDVTELAVALPATDDEAKTAKRLETAIPELASSVGVRRYAVISNPPFLANEWEYRTAPGGEARRARVLFASSEYFATLDIRLLAGRLYANDPRRSEVVVNASLAALLGGPVKAIGTRLHMDNGEVTVVGVTAAAHDLASRAVEPGIYFAFPWTIAPRMIVRGAPDEARRLSSAIMARDPSLFVSMRTYAWYLEDATTSATFAAMVSGAMGTLALVLASIGMFGVLSYWVQQRQQDISVRMALGAAPRNVVGLVLGATARAVGWGLALGLVLAVGAAQLLRSNLSGLSTMDPASYAGAMGVLALAGLLATLLPVRRAVRIEPMQALRGD